MEARGERLLLDLQRQLSRRNLLIVDELGFVPLSRTGAELPGAELLFEVFSQRCERGSILVTPNLPFDEWTGVFGPGRLTGALLDRLTHSVQPGQDVGRALLKALCPVVNSARRTGRLSPCFCRCFSP